MNTRLNKAFKTAMAAAAFALLTAGAAHADANPANDSGSFTVRLTPNVDLGVTVDTSGANWTGAVNLDMTSDLGIDTVLENPVAIAMAGNFNNQELTLTGAALNTWQLDTDEVDAVDQVRLYAMFGSGAYTASSVNSGDFAGVQNLIKTTATRAGQPEADEGSDVNHVYELPIAHGQYTAGAGGEMDALYSTDLRSLWLRARTPNSSSTADQAAFTVIVTAVSGVGL